MRKISFESMDLTEKNGRATEGGLHPPNPLLREMLKEWGVVVGRAKRAHINHKM